MSKKSSEESFSSKKGKEPEKGPKKKKGKKDHEREPDIIQIYENKEPEQDFVQEETEISKIDRDEAGPSDAGTKKKKNLRFAEDTYISIEPLEEDEVPERREMVIQNVMGLRTSPLTAPPSGRVRDIIRAMQADVAEVESMSVVDNSETSVVLLNIGAFQPIFDAMRRYPKKNLSDCNLLMSIYLRSLSGVISALEEGADVNVVQDGQTPLIFATENNDKAIVSYLLSVEKIDLNYQNKFGLTALLIAIRSGFFEIAVMLIEGKADVNIVDNLGKSPLHEALFRENYDLVKILHESSQVYRSDCFGEKPLYTCSVKKPNIGLLSFFLDEGTSCEYENVSGLSLLSRAILNSNSLPVIELLVRSGADVNHEDRFCKRTPLHMAAIINSVPIAKLLFKQSADPNIKTIFGLTPFDLSVYYRSFSVAEYLAQVTSDASLRMDNYRHTLLGRLPRQTSVMFLLKANATMYYAWKSNSFSYD